MDESNESEDLRDILHGFLANLEASPLTAQGRWLVDAINAELLHAEQMASLDWLVANNTDRDGNSRVLSEADRLEIALRVAYHHLVVVPRMWAHVRQFWRAHGQVTVRLMDRRSNDFIELPALPGNDVAMEAANYISQFVDRVEEHYGLAIRQHGWLRREGHEYGE